MEAPDLQKENEELRGKVRELEDTLDAIRSGEVDAIVVSKGDSRQVYTLEGADQPYRVLVENIREGALTLSRTGMILYANTRFAEMAKVPPDKVPGTSILDYICPEYQAAVEEALTQIPGQACRTRVRIRQGKGSLPVLISMNPLDHIGDTKISVVITDRRKDEDRIRMQARMLDAVGDAVIAADTKNKVIYWNNAAARTYGWTAEEAIGKDLVEVATPELSQAKAREIVKKLKNGETWTGEYIVRHRDGHEFPIYASDAPVLDDDGRLIAIIGASHDITARKQAEEELKRRHTDLNQAYEEIASAHEELRQNVEELRKAEKMVRENEEKLRFVLENSWDTIYHLNLLTGRYEYISPSCREVVGYSPEELQALDQEASHEKIHPDDRPALLRLLADLEHAGKGAIEYRQIRKSGDYRWLSNRMSLIKDAAGRPIYRTGNIRDVTERKMAEGALRDSEEKFRAVFENSLFGMATAGADGHIVDANPALADMLGFTREELCAGSFEDFTHPDDLPVEWPLIKDVLARNTDHYEIEKRYIRKNGDIIQVRLIASLITKTGASKLGLAIIEDITERKKQEEELVIREKQLQEALAEKEILLSEVHHRVKNNLTAFISLLSLDGSYVDTEEGKSLRKDLQNRARSMALIHETLYKTRKFSTVDMDIYLSTLVQHIASSYAGAMTVRTQVDACGVTLDLSRATTAGLIINELVTNSFKYAFPEGFDCMATRGEPCTIRVLFTPDDGSYKLTVSDNGIGLPAGLDPCSTKSLGLKLVTFLARHQLLADTEFHTEKGTEFVFKLRNEGDFT